jgi:hypothetical protein
MHLDRKEIQALLANATAARDRSRVLPSQQRQFDETEPLRVAVLRAQADDDFAKRRWQDASNKFEAVAKTVLGISHPINTGGQDVRIEAYAALNFWQRMSLLESLNGLARCMIKENDVHKVC